jgi:hypothetical protein
MKILFVFLCICLLITALAGPVHAQGVSWTRPIRMLTTGLLGATLGVLVGAGVALVAASSTATPIAVGAGVGLAAGMIYAYMTPTEDVYEESTGFQADSGASTGPPP